MSNGIAGGSALVDRVKNILVQPRAEWDRIDAEPMTIQGIFTGYVLILAAIPPVAGLIGQLVFGVPGQFGIVIRPSASMLIAGAVTSYIMSVVAIFAYALVIDALAPTFNSTKSQIQATKVAAFAATPGFVAGILGLIPQLMILALLASLYGLYLLYLGLPRLMKTPQDKAIPYVISVVVAVIVLAIIAGIVISAVSQAFMPSVTSPYLVG